MNKTALKNICPHAASVPFYEGNTVVCVVLEGCAMEKKETESGASGERRRRESREL